MEKEGKKVILRMGGSSRNFKIIGEAMSKMEEWLKDKEDIDVLPMTHLSHFGRISSSKESGRD